MCVARKLRYGTGTRCGIAYLVLRASFVGGGGVARYSEQTRWLLVTAKQTPSNKTCLLGSGLNSSCPQKLASSWQQLRANAMDAPPIVSMGSDARCPWRSEGDATTPFITTYSCRCLLLECCFSAKVAMLLEAVS